MRWILILLSFSSCLNFSEVVEIYSTDEATAIYTENGIAYMDTIRIILDDYIPYFEASPATIDFGIRSPIILNRFSEPILFENDQALFEYMNIRGYACNGIYTFSLNNKKQSAWIFLKY